MDVSKILPRVADRAGGCFLCKWIAEDLRENGALTDYPFYGEGGSGLFKKASKRLHLELEKIL